MVGAHPRVPPDGGPAPRSAATAKLLLPP